MHTLDVPLPPDLQQSIKLAGDYRRAGRMPQAAQILRDALGRHPAHPLLLVQLGELLLSAGDFDAALPLLQLARQRAPGEAPLWLMETQCLLALGRHKDAKKVISEAVRKGLRHPMADEFLRQARSGPSTKSGNLLPLDETMRQLDVMFRAGRYAEVETKSAALLRQYPKSSAAWYLHGMAVLYLGRLEDAVAVFRRALEIDPGMAPALFNLGFALERMGQFEKARATYCRTLEVAPQLADAHNNLGNVLQKLKRHEDALAAYEKAVELMPNLAPFRMNRGDALRDLERLEEAAEAYRAAIELDPTLIEAYVSLAYSLELLERSEESVAVCRQAIERRPECADAHLALANVLRSLKRHEEAAVAYRRVLELKHNDEKIYRSLAKTLLDLQQYNEALVCLQQALKLKPDSDKAFNLMGDAFCNLGRLDDALAVYRRGLQLDPDGLFAMHSNLLLARNYQIDGMSAEHLAEARAFGAKAARKAVPFRRHDNLPVPGRRLRVGLVSGDLGLHPVGFFLQNVVESINPGKIELFAYATARRKDALNQRLRQWIPNWFDAPEEKVSDDALAERIRADGIDILIDLAGHTGKNRLPVFAWKPAPVQVSWLGYLGTTGLDAIDYILADNWALPVGEENQFTETPWRLPESYICFSPPDLQIEVGELPALRTGNVTFGCFNNLTKVTDNVIACWARLLNAVPSSRLFLKTKSLGAAQVRQKIVDAFSRQGISSERLRLEGQFASHEDHFRAYQAVDIALDPFPYPGITTSVEALWMGVPVLTLKGDRFISHQGETILNNIGLPQWIAADEDDYVAKAAAFAGDLSTLAALRAGLREQLLASPLCDAPSFAGNLEEALRGMWRIWCERQKAA
jgi:predicted O-linked N-acetylglucosamine transferase (SPINDLY family)